MEEFLGRELHQLFLGNEQWFYGSAGGKVPYLAFANDPIIFTRCAAGCLQAVLDFLGNCQSYSGQKVNINKSSFVCSPRARAEHLTLVSSILGFCQQSFLMQYLGFPLVKG